MTDEGAEKQSDKGENGKEAVDYFEKSSVGTYDAILMDVRCRLMDGLTASETIEQRNENGQSRCKDNTDHSNDSRECIYR